MYGGMAWNRRSLQEELQNCLDRLPGSFGVTIIGPAAVVVGPTGVYVVMAHDGTSERARALGRLAATVRSAFAERMAWVPFVHALLVDVHASSTAHATVVPPDLLREVLTEGRATLEVETLDTIGNLISQGILGGLESVAPDGDARMGECSISPVPMASSSPSTSSERTLRDRPPSSPTPRVSTGVSGSPWHDG